MFLAASAQRIGEGPEQRSLLEQIDMSAVPDGTSKAAEAEYSDLINAVSKILQDKDYSTPGFEGPADRGYEVVKHFTNTTKCKITIPGVTKRFLHYYDTTLIRRVGGRVFYLHNLGFYGSCLSLLLDIYPEGGKAFDKLLVDLKFCYPGVLKAQIYDIFKEIGIYFKRWRELASIHWQFFADWHEFTDKVAPLTDSQFREEIETFLLEQREFGIPDQNGARNSKALEKLIHDGVWRILSESASDLNRARCAKIGPLSKFKASFNKISTSGADFKLQARGDVEGGKVVGKKLKVEVGGKVFTEKVKNKSTTYMSIPSDQFEKIARMEYNSVYGNDNSITIYPLMKPDDSKPRSIVTGGSVGPHAAGAYVLEFFMTLLSGCDLSPLFFSGEQYQDMISSLCSAHRLGYMSFNFDYKSFDTYINSTHFGGLFSALRLAVSSYAPVEMVDDLNKCLEVCYNTLTKAEVVFQGDSGPSRQQLNGLSSGDRLTAFAGTLINLASCSAILSIMSTAGIYFPVVKYYGQGDDLTMLVGDSSQSSRIGVRAFLAVCEGIGMKSNLRKTSASWNSWGAGSHSIMEGELILRDSTSPVPEFLRKIFVTGSSWSGRFYRRDGTHSEKDAYANMHFCVVGGYVTRGLASIMRTISTGSLKTDVREMVEQRVSLWNLPIGRGASREVCERYMLIDICRSTGLSKDEVTLYLSTPKAYGGIGWFANEGVGLVPVLNVSIPSFSLRLPPDSLYAAGASSIRALGVDVTDKDISSSAATMLSNPAKFSEEIKKTKWNTISVETVKFVKGIELGAVNMTPRWHDSLIDNPLLDELVRRLIREKLWDQILKLMPDDVAPAADLFRSRCGNRMYADWLRGKLIPSPPMVPGWEGKMLSDLTSPLFRSAWAKLVSYGKITYSRYKAVMAGVESFVRKAFLPAQNVYVGA